MVTKNIVSRGVKDLFEVQSFRVGSSAIKMGKPVSLASTGVLNVCGTTANGLLSIGVIDYDNDYVAQNGTTTIAAAGVARVLMDGISQTLETGGTYNAGVFLKLDSSGRVVAETTATTKTVNTIGISLEASTAAAQEKKVLRL